MRCLLSKYQRIKSLRVGTACCFFHCNGTIITSSSKFEDVKKKEKKHALEQGGQPFFPQPPILF